MNPLSFDSLERSDRLLSALLNICNVDARVFKSLVNYAEHLLNTHHYLLADRVDFSLVRRHLMLNITVHGLNIDRVVVSLSCRIDNLLLITCVGTTTSS